MGVGALDIKISADIASLRTSMDSAVGIMQSSTQKMESAAKIAGSAIAGYLAFDHIKESVKQTLDLADSLNKLSQKIGVSVDSLYALKAAGKLADVDIQEIGNSVGKLNKNLGEIQMGGGAAAQNALKNIGISTKDANGHFKDSNAVLLEVSDKFSKMPDGVAKTTVAMALFGKSGKDMIPMLNGGSESLKEFSGVMTSDTAKAAERFNDSLTRLGITTEIFKAKALESMSPLLVAVAQDFENLAKKSVFTFDGGGLVEAYTEIKSYSHEIEALAAAVILTTPATKAFGIAAQGVATISAMSAKVEAQRTAVVVAAAEAQKLGATALETKAMAEMLHMRAVATGSLELRKMAVVTADAAKEAEKAALAATNHAYSLDVTSKSSMVATAAVSGLKTAFMTFAPTAALFALTEIFLNWDKITANVKDNIKLISGMNDDELLKTAKKYDGLVSGKAGVLDKTISFGYKMVGMEGRADNGILSEEAHKEINSRLSSIMDKAVTTSDAAKTKILDIYKLTGGKLTDTQAKEIEKLGVLTNSLYQKENKPKNTVLEDFDKKSQDANKTIDERIKLFDQEKNLQLELSKIELERFERTGALTKDDLDYQKAVAKIQTDILEKNNEITQLSNKTFSDKKSQDAQANADKIAYAKKEISLYQEMATAATEKWQATDSKKAEEERLASLESFKKTVAEYEKQQEDLRKAVETTQTMTDNAAAYALEQTGSSIDAQRLRIMSQYDKLIADLKDKKDKADLAGLFEISDQFKTQIALTTQEMTQKLNETTLSFKVENSFFTSFESSLSQAMQNGVNHKIDLSTISKAMSQALLKTVTDSAASYITGGLKSALSGSSGGGSSFGDLFSAGKAGVDIYTGAGMSAGSLQIANNVVGFATESAMAAGVTAEAAGAAAASTMAGVQMLATAMPYLALAAVAAPVLIQGIGGSTKVTGSGVQVMDGNYYGYQDSKYSNWFNSSSKHSMTAIDAGTQAAILGEISAYETLLKNMGAGIQKIKVDAGTYAGQSLLTDIIPKEFLENLMSSAMPSSDADVERVYNEWRTYATSVQTSVSDAVTGIFSTDSQVVASIRKLNLDAQGIDGAASVAIESASAVQQQMLTVLATAINSVSGLGFSAADVTVSNFQEMHDKLIATNPTPSMISAFDAYGRALEQLSNSVREGAGKVLSASAQTAVTAATTSKTVAAGTEVDPNTYRGEGGYKFENGKFLAVGSTTQAAVLPAITTPTMNVLPSTGAATGGTSGGGTPYTFDKSSLMSSFLTDSEKLGTAQKNLAKWGYKIGEDLGAFVKSFSESRISTEKDGALFSDSVKTITDSIKTSAEKAKAFADSIKSDRESIYKNLGAVLGQSYIGGKYWSQENQSSYFMRTSTTEQADYMGKLDDWLSKNQDSKYFEGTKQFKADYQEAYTAFVSGLKSVSTALSTTHDTLQKSIRAGAFELLNLTGDKAAYGASVIQLTDVEKAITAVGTASIDDKQKQIATSQELISEYVSQQTALQGLTSGIENAKAGVLDFVKNLRIGNLSPLNNIQKSVEFKGEFEKYLLALKGATTVDAATTASSKAQTYASSYLDALKASAGSSFQYAQAFNVVSGQLADVAKLPDGQNDANSIAKKQLEAQIDLKKTQEKLLGKLDGSVLGASATVNAKLSEVAGALNIPAPVVNVSAPIVNLTVNKDGTVSQSYTAATATVSQGAATVDPNITAYESWKANYAEYAAKWNDPAWDKASIAASLRANAQQVDAYGALTGHNDKFYASVDGWLKTKGFSQGGHVFGEGTETSDSIPARLSNGEFVLTAKTVRNNRDLVANLDRQQKGFATGGSVGSIPLPNSGNRAEILEISATLKAMLSETKRLRQEFDDWKEQGSPVKATA
jgi:hypothetical protein